MVALTMSGCATLFAGGNETVTIDSDPPQARVTAQNGQVLGTTPLTTSLKPADYVLTFTKDGYNPTTYSLTKKVDGIAFLNLLCVLCWGIDFATGAVWGLTDSMVRVTMNRISNDNALPSQAMMDLACLNYTALQSAHAGGVLNDVQHSKATKLVQDVTNTRFSMCSTKAPLR
jgi:hypothetical protein